MHTTHDDIAEHDLQRTVGFEDRPGEFVVWVEWRIAIDDAHHQTCAVCQTPGMPVPSAGLVLVRRDAHVIKKDSPAEIGAVAARLKS
jgi:hypothetical protein